MHPDAEHHEARRGPRAVIGLAARAVRERLRAHASLNRAEEVELRALTVASLDAIPEAGLELGIFLERALIPTACNLLGEDVADLLALELRPIAAMAARASSNPPRVPRRRRSAVPTMVPTRPMATAVVESGVKIRTADLASAPPTRDEKPTVADLELVEEAMAHETPTVRPEAFEPQAAELVYTRSAALATDGPSELGLQMAEDAVTLRRTLAEDDPAGQAEALAQALHNLGLHLGALGRSVEALLAFDEAVMIRRRLATDAHVDRAGALEAQLARSLHGLALQLARLDRHEEALDAIDETIAIRRCLGGEELREALSRAEKLRHRLRTRSQAPTAALG